LLLYAGSTFEVNTSVNSNDVTDVFYGLRV